MKMNNWFIMILSVIFLFGVSSCHPVNEWVPFFTFENNSDRALGLIIRHSPPESPYSRKEILYDLWMYPGEKAFDVWYGEVNILKAFEKYPKLYLYIFDRDTLWQYYDDATECKLIENHRELRLMELTNQESSFQLSWPLSPHASLPSLRTRWRRRWRRRM